MLSPPDSLGGGVESWCFDCVRVRMKRQKPSQIAQQRACVRAATNKQGTTYLTTLGWPLNYGHGEAIGSARRHREI